MKSSLKNKKRSPQTNAKRRQPLSMSASRAITKQNITYTIKFE